LRHLIFLNRVIRPQKIRKSGVAMPAAYFMAASSARWKSGLSDQQAPMIALGIEHD
jgi:hypothetical protein